MKHHRLYVLVIVVALAMTFALLSNGLNSYNFFDKMDAYASAVVLAIITNGLMRKL